MPHLVAHERLGCCLALQGIASRKEFSGDPAMIRRAVLVAAAAVALILAPTAAMAQAPAGFTVPQVNPTAAGVPFKVIASGAKANEAVTLTMTPDPASIGTTSLTQIANARGVATFVVTLTADGTYLLVSKSASGVVLTSQTVTVSDHGAVIVAGTSAAAGTVASVPAGKAVTATAGTAASAATGTAARGQLAFTGFGGMGLLVGGGVLVLAGTGLVLVVRRRTPAQP
jgi:hypothetical protein